VPIDFHRGKSIATFSETTGSLILLASKPVLKQIVFYKLQIRYSAARLAICNLLILCGFEPVAGRPVDWTKMFGQDSSGAAGGI